MRPERTRGRKLRDISAVNGTFISNYKNKYVLYAAGIQGGGKIDGHSGGSRNFMNDGSDQGSIWKDISNIAGELVKSL